MKLVGLKTAQIVGAAIVVIVGHQAAKENGANGAKIVGIVGEKTAGMKKTGAGVMKVVTVKAVGRAAEEVQEVEVVVHQEEVPAGEACRSAIKSTMKKKLKMVFNFKPLKTWMTWSINSWKTTVLLITT